jgi:hypothetical protein
VLTDDDLTRQLRAAFEEDTRGVRYDGAVPRVRTRPAWAAPGWVALPAAGAVAAAVLVLGSTGTPTPATPGTATAPPSRTPSATSTPATTVTDTFTLAGMTFTYERGADDVPLDDQFLRVYDPGQLPAWAEPVALESGASAEVWVGQDPATGDVSMFVSSPERWSGALTGLASPSITVEQMTSLARTGRLS